jgi:hypothetical protein
MPGSRHSYVTLVTSEFLAIIEEYLEFRRRQGKRVVAESPQKAEANRPHPILKVSLCFQTKNYLRKKEASTKHKVFLFKNVLDQMPFS